MMNLHQSVVVIIDCLREDAENLRFNADDRSGSAKDNANCEAVRLDHYAAELEQAMAEDKELRRGISLGQSPDKEP